ncbi:hypothetical protein TNCV_70941 [Trichonephila clavipes]|nr:hypothetical protein TNCV_70941 [Trichonephila clavipes]
MYQGLGSAGPCLDTSLDVSNPPCIQAFIIETSSDHRNRNSSSDYHKIRCNELSRTTPDLLCSWKKWEIRKICQLATCEDRRLCISQRLSPYTIITPSVIRSQLVEPVYAIGSMASRSRKSTLTVTMSYPPNLSSVMGFLLYSQNWPFKLQQRRKTKEHYRTMPE